MTSKDVLDQIRDLQSFIDDFAADAGSPPPMVSPVALATPLTRHTILHKPDEKTEIEEPKQIEEKTLEEEEPAEDILGVEEKTLIEPPLSILSYNLNLSDDFSSLLTQFKEIKVSPTKSKQIPQQNTYKEEEEEEEKIQVEVIPASIENYASTPKFSDSFFLIDHLPTGNSSKSHSRRTSISSKKSQRSARSARRQNEKKLQHKQQLQQQQQQQPQKYVERSYDEMMRIPDIYERMAFYEKTLDLCLKAESPISGWCKANREKGKPAPLLEGYIPPVRLLSPEVPISDNTFGSMSGTFSGSISMFLKKAGGSQSTSRRMENKSLLASSSSYNTPHTPSNYYSGSGLFGKSLSKLSLSRSTQMPRYDHQLQQIKTPAATRLTMMHNNRVSSPAPRKKKSSVDTMNKNLSPLCTNYGKDSPSPIRTPRSSLSTPSSFGSTTTINSQGEFTSQSKALNYMINVLPQIDLHILQSALDEAKGDPMVAISLAVSKSKLADNHHQPMQAHKRLSSSRHCNGKVK